MWPRCCRRLNTPVIKTVMPSPISSKVYMPTQPALSPDIPHAHGVITAGTNSKDKKVTVLESHGYVLGKSIGSGSYATVRIVFAFIDYKVAHSERHEGNVAVKIVSKFTAPADYLKKFLPREIEVVKGLKHPNLIRFLQAIETTHRVYIIMEYAENGSLLDMIRKDSYIDEPRARNWFRQLADAVEYCHGRGVVHRDIKCENMLMDRGLNIKLSDFGFARGHMRPKSGQLPFSETFCGSYAYASPEILRGIPYQPQYSDIWSMGVVLYAMVYGRLPFDDTNYNLLLKQVSNKVTFPREPKVSNSCRSLINKILTPLKIRIRFIGIRHDIWFNGGAANTSQKLSSNLENTAGGPSNVEDEPGSGAVHAILTKQQLKSEAKPRDKHRYSTDEETPITHQLPDVSSDDTIKNGK